MRKGGQVHRRPQALGDEHPENITIDPIISMDGRLWDAQIIYAGKELHSGLIPNIPDVCISVTETVCKLCRASLNRCFVHNVCRDGKIPRHFRHALNASRPWLACMAYNSRSSWSWMATPPAIAFDSSSSAWSMECKMRKVRNENLTRRAVSSFCCRRTRRTCGRPSIASFDCGTRRTLRS